MQKLIVTILSLLILWTGVGNAETRTAENFNAVTINGPYTVKITVGEPASITLTSKDDTSKVITEVKDHTLSIRSQDSANTNKNILITVTLPELHSLNLAGDSKVSITGLHGSQFALTANGNAQAELAGIINNFNLELSGNTNIDGKKLTAKVIELNANGATQVSVHTNNELHIKANGDAIVKVYGTPRVVTTSMIGNSKLQMAK